MIPVIDHGKRVPYGLSRRIHTMENDSALMLKFPLWVAYVRKYSVNEDDFRIGWHTFSVFMSIGSLGRGHGFTFRLGYGYVARPSCKPCNRHAFPYEGPGTS